MRRVVMLRIVCTDCYLCAVDGSPASAGPNNIALRKWVGQHPIVVERMGSIWRKPNEEGGGSSLQSSPSWAELDNEASEKGAVSQTRNEIDTEQKCRFQLEFGIMYADGAFQEAQASRVEL